MSTMQKNLVARTILTAFALLACVRLAAAQERVPFPDNVDDGKGPTRSEFGEFVVKGPDAYTRGTYCDFAVEARRSYQKLMNVGGRLKYPVVIDLKTVPGNRVRGHPVKPLIIVNHTYSPNVQVALCESFRFSYLREELVRFFLMDYALRRHGNVTDLVEKRGNDLIPKWLWAGVSEAISFQEAGEPSEIFAALYQSGTIMSVDDILKGDPEKLGTLSRAIYRASSGGLVLTLLQQDGGAARMRNFIDALAVAPQDQEALLRKFFPGIDDSNNSLEKWWALQAAQLAKPTSLDILSIAETEAQLKRALLVAVMEDRAGSSDALPPTPRPKPRLRLFGKRDADIGAEERLAAAPVEAERVIYELSEYWRFAGHPEIEGLLHQNELRLVQLSYRSFPLYRPLIKAYLELVEEIAAGETKGVDARLAALAETRAGLVRSGQLVEDFMNLDAATKSGSASMDFDGYFKLFEHLRSNRPMREDKISKYLDRIQAEYE
jgi:hypothetical protein